MKKSKYRKENVEIDNLRVQLARALADYDNFKKRTERERVGIERLTKSAFLGKIIPAIDMFYLASEHLKDSGLESAVRTLEQNLREAGMERFEAQPGEEFDEEIHEAVESVEDDKMGKGKVSDSVSAGYRFEHGEIIRYAKVIVTK